MGSERCGDSVSGVWIPTQSDLDEMGIGCLKECNEVLKLWDGQRYIWIIDATGMRGSFSQPLLFCASAISYPTACQLFTQTAIWFLVSCNPLPLLWPSFTNPRESSDLTTLDQPGMIKTAESYKNKTDHSNHMGQTQGKERGKQFPKRRGIYVPRSKGKKKKNPIIVHYFQEGKPTRLLSKEESDSLKLHHFEISLGIWGSDHLWHFNSV